MTQMFIFSLNSMLTIPKYAVNIIHHATRLQNTPLIPTLIIPKDAFYPLSVYAEVSITFILSVKL